MSEARRVEAATILVVDDEEMNVELLESFLAEDGYAHVTSTRDPRRVLPLDDEIRPDLILLDLHMPYLDGFEVMERLAERIPGDDLVPILVLTADITPESRERALAGGAKDFVNKPLDETEVLLRIRNLLQTRMLYLDQRAERIRAEAAGRRASILAEASRVLGASLDTQTTLTMLAGCGAPELADACVVELVGEEGEFMPVGHAPEGPWSEALLTRAAASGRGMLGLCTSERGDPSPEAPVRLSLRQGDAPGTSGDPDGAAAAASLIWAPMVTAGRTIGALSLVAVQHDRAFHADDVALAGELARRAALAVENARLYRDAQEATRARDEILAVVAHDLRNPLSTIGMAVSMLKEAVPEGPSHRHLDIVGRSADRMNRLIQDLVEVTRMETGKLILELREEPVPLLIEEAMQMLRPLAAARSIELTCEMPNDLPPLRMDSARILQVLSNLVGNAIKFTPANGLIRLGCEATDEGVRFTVADSGTGIPPEQLPHVFGRFWQASDADRRGMGLGLSIARGIVEAHGGAIWVESTFGAGTSFFFTIPAERVAETDPLSPPRNVVTVDGGSPAAM